MGTLPQSAPEPERNPRGHDPVVHGSKAAIAAAIFAGLAMIGTFAIAYVNWSNRSDQKTQRATEQADAHINAFIDLKLNPAVKAVNDNTNEKFGELSNQIHELDVRIARLEGPLTKRVSSLEYQAHQQSIRENITEYALAKPDDLKRDLPQVGSTLRTASEHKVKVTAPVLSDLQKGLNAIAPSTLGYWPTAAQFISYRSQNTVPDFASLALPDLPNCTDHNPTPMKLIVSDEEAKNGKAGDVANVPDLLNETDKNKTHMVPAVYKDCRFTLDSPEETARIPNLGEGRSYVLTFRHCQIVYRGGQITLLTPHPSPLPVTGRSHMRSDVYIITGQTVHFENCLFLFAINSTPPVEGQSLTQQLLDQNGPRLTVTFPQATKQS
jgi:hypothetical protein